MGLRAMKRGSGGVTRNVAAGDPRVTRCATKVSARDSSSPHGMLPRSSQLTRGSRHPLSDVTPKFTLRARSRCFKDERSGEGAGGMELGDRLVALLLGVELHLLAVRARHHDRRR